MNIRNFTVCAFLIIGYLFCVSETNAQKMTVPPGSYQRSCINFTVKGNVLQANCNFSGGDKTFKSPNDFEDFFLCADDIRNDDGRIKCTKSDNTPLMKKALAAYNTASEIHYGVPNEGGISGAVSEVRKMFKDGFPDIVDKFYKGLSPADAGQSIEAYVRRPDRTALRLLLISRAFQNVYGTDNSPSPQDVAFYNAENMKSGIFYQNILSGETKKLNAPGNKIVRRAMIMFAYKKMMGRNPTKEETAFWEPKTEIYKQILASGRDFLYSTSGAKDLSETVERKLTEKQGKKPSVVEINNTMVQYAKTKAIYAEM